jgi:deoxycytidylate deaminase
MAALIYRGSRVISAAVNILKSHPDHLVYYPEWVCSIHAEHAALLKARTSVSGGTVYVVRYQGLTSKPCNGCLMLLVEAGVKEVVYMDNGRVSKMQL